MFFMVHTRGVEPCFLWFTPRGLNHVIYGSHPGGGLNHVFYGSHPGVERTYILHITGVVRPPPSLGGRWTAFCWRRPSNPARPRGAPNLS